MRTILFVFYSLIVTESFGQIINFPDPNFKQALIDEGVDSSLDGEISILEASAVSELNVTNDSISDLSGIEYFTNLTTLNCSENLINSINLSSNSKLIDFNCESNNLSDLDLSSNTFLKTVNCSYNQLAGIDFSLNDSIKTLIIVGNPLSSIDVSNLSQLTYFVIGETNISSLNISNNTLLDSLSCGRNNLSSLDVSHNPNLSFLYCDYNDLTQIVLNNPNLKLLSCNNNKLVSLDVSNAPNLVELSSVFNSLNNLQVSNMSYLKTLNTGMNNLNQLDVSGDTALFHLNCSSNNLSKLFLNNNVGLRYLYVVNNNFTQLNLLGAPKLKSLECSDNPFTQLTIDHSTLEHFLMLNVTTLTSLDISQTPTISVLSLAHMPQPFKVCVWTLPFPPNNVATSTMGSPNITYVLCTDSIEEIGANYTSIFPNPTDEFINVEFNSENSIMNHIRLSNSTGENVYSNVTDHSIQIDVSNLSAGIYLLSIMNNGKSINRKIVIE